MTDISSIAEYPDQISESVPGESMRITHDLRRHWPAWRSVTSSDPHPQSLGLPWSNKPAIVNVKGAELLLISCTTDPLQSSGDLVDVSAWEGRLWVCSGPPGQALWSLYDGSETGAMSADSLHKEFPLRGAWYASWQITSITTAGGALLVSARAV